MNNPEAFVAGIGTILAQYPPELHAVACGPLGIPRYLKRLDCLADIESVCRSLYEPIARRLERERIAAQPRALPRPPRTAEEQARIDEQVARVRRPIGRA